MPIAAISTSNCSRVELRGDVLEVGDEQEAVLLAVNRQKPREVVVEAELAALRRAALLGDVEFRRVGQRRRPS